MLTTAEASRKIAASMTPLAAERVPLADAAGRVLRETVSAERDQPPFDRVTMDGIAIRHAAWASGRRRFRVQAARHAGEPRIALGDDACIEIMTGAVLPDGADCVIPIERVTLADGEAQIEDGYEPASRQFIHPRGSDHEAGTRVLEGGRVITPMDVAIIASCGLDKVAVSRRPTIRLISTGDELVPAGQPIEPHQIRMSNGPALMAMLVRQSYSDCLHDHVVDDEAILRERIGEHLDAADVLILSGGVSMGKADFVPVVLRELGVEPVFHRISQRPGKPMWFGIGPDGQAVFALPGNPVSSLVCCRQYVLPALYLASGRQRAPADRAMLAEPVTFGPALTCFLPVRLAAADDAIVRATPVTTNTSGDFTALGGTDGYVELALEESEFAAGRVVPLHRWDTP